MFKEIEVPYLTSKDEPSVNLVHPGYKEKVAETRLGSQIYKELEDFEGEPNKSYMLVVAVSPVEYWGDNKNNDAFTEEWLKKKHHTFTTDGTFFKNHVNKDPLKNYGDNVMSWYDDEMKRVLVLIGVDHDKAPDIVNDLENGRKISVSMGCLRRDAQVLMADWTLKPISELKSGDLVINALGEVSEVDYAHNHAHGGTWYYPKILGIREAEPTTEEHPYLILPKDYLEGLFRREIADEHILPIWKRADELSIGDYVGTPVLQGRLPCEETDEFIKLLGFYLSDGWLSTSSSTVSWSVNFTVNKDKVDFIKKSLPSFTISERPHKDSDKAVHLYIHNSNDLALKINELCGRSALGKRIHPTIMKWPTDKQKILLGALFSSDGGVYQGSLYYSTANYGLANQIHHILLRCDMVSSINKISHKPSTIVKKHTVEYQVWCGKSWAYLLKDFIFKSDEIQDPTVIDGKRFIAGGYLWSPIQDINTEPCNEDVYNVAIKSDCYDSDSYLVNNVALHNCRIPYDVCSICGNKAPTTADYCKCMKQNKGQILPDGRKVFVYNPDPTFFDLSKVVRPAGHIEYMIKKILPKMTKEGSLWVPRSSVDEGMKKVASSEELFMQEQDFADKFAKLDKLCEMEKVIDGEVLPEDKMPKPLQEIVRKSKKIINIGNPEDLDDETICALGEHPLKNIMSTANLMGIRFKIPEMSKLVIMREGKDDVDELKHNLDRVGFDPIELLAGKSPFEYLKNNPKVMKIIIDSKIVDSDARDMDEKVASILSPWFDARSIYPAALEKRAFAEKVGRARLEPTPVYDAQGNEYLTTQEAIDRASETEAARNALWGLGTGAALLGTGLAATRLPLIGSKYLLPASTVGTLWGSKKLYDAMKDPGLSTTVPSDVVLQKVSHLIDKYDLPKYEKVANQFQEMVNGLFPKQEPPKPSLYEEYGRPVWEWAQRNPEAATLGSLFAAGVGLKGLDKAFQTARKGWQAAGSGYDKMKKWINTPGPTPAQVAQKDMETLQRLFTRKPS